MCLPSQGGVRTHETQERPRSTCKATGSVLTEPGSDHWALEPCVQTLRTEGSYFAVKETSDWNSKSGVSATQPFPGAQKTKKPYKSYPPCGLGHRLTLADTQKNALKAHSTFYFGEQKAACETN